MRDIHAEVMPVGFCGQEDALLFTQWMWRQKESSNFDPQVLVAPSACMVKVIKGESTIAYMPIQTVISLESLCNDEDLSKSELTLTVYEIHLLIKKIMEDSGIREAFLTTSNERFVYLCEGQGWKKYLFDQEKHTWLMKLQIGSL